MSACNNDKEVSKARKKQDTLYISCDETFKPVIDEEVKVFSDAHPEARIIVSYKPEADCLKDLLIDSIGMVIIAKQLTKVERNFIIDSLKTGIEQFTVAYDAIAVITHPQSTDSMFTMNEIRELVGGKANNNLIPVFDGTKATSTVRFMIDTVLKGGKLGSSVVAAPNSQAVLDYVSKNPKAIGFIGISWIGNKEDTTQLSFLKKVKIAYLESTDSAGAYVKPFQYHLYTGSYPMVRDLVYVVKERDQYGLAHQFANFLEHQRGQLIFRRSYLAPAIMPSVFRQTELNESIEE